MKEEEDGDGADGRQGGGRGQGAERGGRGDPGDRMAEALAHVQAAALELIAAARAALDVAEDLVREPAVALLVAGTVAEALRAAQAAAGGGNPPGERPQGDDAAAPGENGTSRTGVQHIRVSQARGGAGRGDGEAVAAQGGPGPGTYDLGGTNV